MAAIKELEEAMPEELLDEDADWFQAWKESGYDQQQQDHLDDARHALFFNSCVRQQQILEVLNRKIIQIVVGASYDPLQHRDNQLFERPGAPHRHDQRLKN